MKFGCVFSKKYMIFAQIPNVSYVEKKISFPFFKKNLINLFFDWMIITLQNFVFCQTSTWISHRYTYVPYLLKFCHLSYLHFLSFLLELESACLSLPLWTVSSLRTINGLASQCWASACVGRQPFIYSEIFVEPLTM